MVLSRLPLPGRSSEALQVRVSGDHGTARTTFNIPIGLCFLVLQLCLGRDAATAPSCI